MNSHPRKAKLIYIGTVALGVKQAAECLVGMLRQTSRTRRWLDFQRLEGYQSHTKIFGSAAREHPDIKQGAQAGKFIRLWRIPVESMFLLKLGKAASLSSFVALMLFGPAAAQASDDSSLIQYPYQRWNQAGLGTKYPEDGPYIQVSASNMTYDRVLNRQSDTQVLVYGYPLCGRRFNRTNLSARVGTGPASSGADLMSHWPWKLALPRADFDDLEPVRQCNESALDHSRSSGRPLQEILQEGFAVRIPRAVRASSRFTCEGRGLRRSELKGGAVDLDAWIHCMPNPTAGRARSGTPITRGRSPERSDGDAIHGFAGAQVSIADSHQASQCPARVLLKAELEFAAPGEVVAQWHTSGDYRSPAQTFDVKGPGSTSIEHSLLIEPPKGTATALASATDDDRITGWAMLVVTYEVRSGRSGTPVRANRTWRSERLNYEITCLPESQPRMHFRRLPGSGSGG